MNAAESPLDHKLWQKSNILSSRLGIQDGGKNNSHGNRQNKIEVKN